MGFITPTECFGLCLVLLSNQEKGKLQTTCQETESEETETGSGNYMVVFVKTVHTFF